MTNPMGQLLRVLLDKYDPRPEVGGVDLVTTLNTSSFWRELGKSQNLFASSISFKWVGKEKPLSNMIAGARTSY